MIAPAITTSATTSIGSARRMRDQRETVPALSGPRCTAADVIMRTCSVPAAVQPGGGWRVPVEPRLPGELGPDHVRHQAEIFVLLDHQVAQPEVHRLAGVRVHHA